MTDFMKFMKIMNFACTLFIKEIKSQRDTETKIHGDKVIETEIQRHSDKETQSHIERETQIQT